MRMTVIGTGYLRAVRAACMAELGHEVLGVDSDIQKIAALQETTPHTTNPHSKILIQLILVQQLSSRRLFRRRAEDEAHGRVSPPKPL